MRIAAICFLGFSSAAAAQPWLQPPPRPITEVDVYQDIARTMELLGMQEGVAVRTGGGMQGDRWFGSFEGVYRKEWRSWRELLPNTLAVGVWTDGTVPISIGYTFELGLFDAPVVTANAIGTADGRLGFDVGFGYEKRVSLHWALAVDGRIQALWPTERMEESPLGARGTFSLRYFFD